MKKILLTAFCCVSSLLTWGQLPVHLKTITSGSFDVYSTLALASTDNGAIIFCNPEKNLWANFFNEQNNHLIKVDSTGTVKWVRKIRSNNFLSSTETSRFLDACHGEDSTFAAVGMSSNTSSSLTPEFGNGFIIKFQANGDTLWCRKMFDSAFPILHPLSISPTLDSGYVICGMAITPSVLSLPYAKSFIGKITGNGLFEWLKIDTGAFAGAGVAARQTPDSGFVMIGGPIYFDGPPTVLSRFSSSGDFQWAKTFQDTFTGGIGQDVRLVDDGLICLGSSTRLNLFKTDFAGNILWSKQISKSTLLADGPRSYKLTLVNKDHAVISCREQFGTVLFVANSGTDHSCKNVYLTFPDVVQLKNKNLLFISNEHHVLSKQTTDSIVPGSLQVIVTDSIGSGTAQCYQTINLPSTSVTLSTTTTTFSFRSGGLLSSANPTISPGTALNFHGCMGVKLSVEEPNLLEVILYPNPTSSWVQFRSPYLDGYDLQFELIDISGRTVMHDPFTMGPSARIILPSNLPASAYLYIIKDKRTTVSRGKLLVNKLQ